jgi:tetratricopeptide (TPR) repeat protein
MRTSLFATASFAALLLAAPAMGCEKHQPKKAAQNELKQFGAMPHRTPRPKPSAKARLWPNLTAVSFPISTKNSLAQRYFNQGLLLGYGFNHTEARRSFQAAQELDPSCAMCFWAEALVLGPNINAPMDAGANEAALAAVRKAKALLSEAGEAEQALIEALSLRYSADPKAERAALDRVYADAMAQVARRFPADLNIATLAAEALMDLTPWDYWQSGGAEPKGRTAEILALLEGVLARNPDHPGAIHFYIHAVEASDRPERAEPYADRLARMELGAGHLVHMPSHIYYRIGRYKDSLAVNKNAVAADEAYLGASEASGMYSGGYYPHNIHFLMVSAQMAGDGPTAIAAALKLEQAISDHAARTYPWVQPIKAAPLLAHAQFSAHDTVLSLKRPSGDFPYVDGLWRYARGVAFAAKGDHVAAAVEAEGIAAIAKDTDWTALVSGGLPAPDVLTIAREIVLGRIAQAKGDKAGAVAAFERAATIEDRLSYMEPPFWYFPVRQALGAALLQADDVARAEEAFRASLKSAPNNGWALFGLHEALTRRGDTAERRQIAERLEQAWAGDRSLLALSRL